MLVGINNKCYKIAVFSAVKTTPNLTPPGLIIVKITQILSYHSRLWLKNKLYQMSIIDFVYLCEIHHTLIGNDIFLSKNNLYREK